MDRRTFLKGTAALTAATLLPRGLARPDPGMYSTGIASIDDLLDGGSADRRALLDKLADDQTLTRQLATIYNLPTDGHGLTEDEIAVERNKLVATLTNLAAATTPDCSLPYRPDEAADVSLDEAVGLAAPHLGTFAALARSTALDDRFLIGKMTRESNGVPTVKYGNALGLLQVELGTYGFFRNRGAIAVSSNREVMPQWLHDEFVSGERPLRDALLFTPDLAKRMGLRLEKRSIGETDTTYLDQWLPFGIVLERYHDGTFPGTRDAEASLLDPETNLKAGGLVALAYLLGDFSIAKELSLAHDAYDPAQVLADPAYHLIPDVTLTSFNAGPGNSQPAFVVAARELGPDYSPEQLRTTYDQVQPTSRTYRRLVLRSTGLLQERTNGSVASAKAA